MAAHFLGLFEQDGSGNADQACGQMSDGHLIAYGFQSIVSGLFNFPVTQPRKILLDELPVLKCFLEFL